MRPLAGCRGDDPHAWAPRRDLGGGLGWPAGRYLHGRRSEATGRTGQTDFTVSVGSVCGHSPKTVTVDQQVRDAADLLRAARVDQLPVVDATDGRSGWSTSRTCSRRRSRVPRSRASDHERRWRVGIARVDQWADREGRSPQSPKSPQVPQVPPSPQVPKSPRSLFALTISTTRSHRAQQRGVARSAPRSVPPHDRSRSAPCHPTAVATLHSTPCDQSPGPDEP